MRILGHRARLLDFSEIKVDYLGSGKSRRAYVVSNIKSLVI